MDFSFYAITGFIGKWSRGGTRLGHL